MPKRLERIVRAAVALQRHDDPDVRDVGSLLLSWWWAGAEQSLDSALGLKSHGGVSVGKTVAIADRDLWIKRLRRQVPGWDELSGNALAIRMLASFERYQSSRWPRERAKHIGPAQEPELTWWRILKDGGTLPRTRQLRGILQASE